jgi:hypothetical protein
MAFTNLPPNLKDMFYNLGDRIAKLETGPNQAMYTAVVANEEASQAIQEATQALIQAQSAYALGSQALIKDSNTITNAQNQMTAINTSGITVYSGASASSGARVIMNSAGIAGYNSGGTATFSVLSSTGAVSTTGAIFTSSTISGGSLNINGNAIITTDGFLTCYGATITGTIYASAGSFAGSVTSTSGAIGGFDIGATYLQNPAGTIRFNSNTATATMAGLTVNGSISTAGITNSSTLSMGGNAINNAGNISQSGTLTGNTGITSSGVITTSSNISTTSSGSITASGELNAAGHQTTGNTANGYVFTTGGRIARSTASSARYKENIVNLIDVPELDPRKLLDFKVRAFSYKEDYLKNDDRAGVLIPGLIAEEVDAIYPLAVDYVDGLIENINDRAILINLLALVQDQETRIKTLEGN